MNYLKKTIRQVDKALSSSVEETDGYKGHGRYLLHGKLHIIIRAAKNLPDMESWLSKVYDDKDVTDPFVDVRLSKSKLVKTGIKLNDLNPEWNESFHVEVCHLADEIIFEVRDKDHAYSEFIGAVTVPCPDVMGGQSIDGWFPILDKKGRKTSAELSFFVCYRSKHHIQPSYEVPCYFEMHRNCRVTLYQDACVPHGMPQFMCLQEPDGNSHIPASYFKDVYYALQKAKYIICISGWAVWDKLQLLRGPDLAIDRRTLGEILIAKSEQGVRVYLMLWSEKTSGDFVGEKGMMGTHDMETFNFFKDTKVICALTPREISCHELTDYLQNQFATGAYTHHQKSIMLDQPNENGGTSLVAFVGGLDLTGGRWDTPDHNLYSSLLNEHLGDFRNKNVNSIPPEQGPREPWHDIHCRVEGPVAYDVFRNFYERWMMQATEFGTLEPLNTSVIELSPCFNLMDQNKEWNCQVFRSITSDSAVFDSERIREGFLNGKKGRLVDTSMSQAYIQHIRNAQNFIYIENQYFLGSAYCWKSIDPVNCNHIIPREIVQRIVDKINLGERFMAYIVIPMFPEGDPSSAPIQEILAWQYKTIEMMYAKVAEALKHAGMADGHPTDWLLFLCPGKRESYGEHFNYLEEATEPMAAVFRRTLRFPIYVHSKMMIVDDAYIIVGSANINQRSMAGTRDTELAIGSWQPAYLASNPFGDVHCFRMSLWAEHIRTMEEVFRYPATLECVRRVKEIALYNWQIYNGPPDNGAATPGQILPYPINVLCDGSLEPLTGVEQFPDFQPGCKVKGKISAMIPQKITT